jgi:hypothetical protein
MPEFATIHSPGTSAVAEAPVSHVPDLEWDDEDVIDAVLRLVADHHRAVGAAIGRRSFSPTLAELRQSPLGQDLRSLAAAGVGDINRNDVRETAARVTDLLLRPLAGESLVIPVWFWSSAIGRIVARAMRATFGDGGLILVVDAADRLGVDSAVIMGWIADGAIAAVPDESGRLVVPRDAIEQRRIVARDLSSWPIESGEDVLVREQRLAS